MKSKRHFYEFGPYRLDTGEKILLREGEILPLTPKAFDVLLALVENSSHVLEKDNLMKRVWPNTCVEEVNLANNISLLRKVLGDTGDDHYIQTVPRRGYRFVASVREVRLDDSEGRIESPSGAPEEEDRLHANSQLITAALEAPGGKPTRTTQKRRWQAVIAFAILLAGTATLYLRSTGGPKAARDNPAIKSIAVLPFRQSGGDAEYIGLGIADSLITRLTNLHEIKVRPTSSVLKYNNLPNDPGQIGRELGVEAVLEGSIRRDGQTVRITVQLVRVEDGSPLWAEKFDDKFTSIFKIEDSMSQRVAESLLPKLTGEEKAVLAKRYTDNAEAYNEYLMGRLFWNKRTVDGMKKAIEHFDNAVALDRNYALAYAGLADCHLLLYSYSDLADKEEIPRAKAAATKALQIDTMLSEAHTSLAYVLYMERDISGAEREYKQAIELNPNYATAYHRYANLQASAGRPDDALQTMKRAQELDPLSLIINTSLGQIYNINGRYDEAIEQLRKTLEMDPTFIHARGFLGMAYLKRGMYEDAIREIEKARELSDDSVPPQVVSYRGYIYGVTGKRSAAKKILKDLLDLRKQRHVSAPHIAIIYAGLGETDQAFTWLETAYREGELGFGWLNDPGFDSLRLDPRFADLRQRISIRQ
ncbi:MAG TPA: tetratricopeptide repeat protein [Blastocatellia bacterium]|nr:tetratricopeptide repeat protein [Blastocatellia bacterium]